MRTSDTLAQRCRDDGEFRLAARHWTGGLRFDFGDGTVAAVTLRDGELIDGDPGTGDGVITLSGPPDLWGQMLAARPPRFANDIAPARALGLRRQGDELLYWQYAPAIQRAVELLRDRIDDRADEARHPLPPGPAAGTVEDIVGRYVHVELGGVDHRVYVEEAGAGIPLLCQHTAGSHSAQWRHVLTNQAITERFRVIAYDLPFHGKSIPPVGPIVGGPSPSTSSTAPFLRSVPRALAAALGSRSARCSWAARSAGLLALDLAARHRRRVPRRRSRWKGALRVDGDWNELARVLAPAGLERVEGPDDGRPHRPKRHRSSVPEGDRSRPTHRSWPPAFLGDLWYYLVDYDLTELAPSIDTTRCAVHILNGHYDYSATVEKGAEAHAAIAGSTFTRDGRHRPLPDVGEPRALLRVPPPGARRDRQRPVKRGGRRSRKAATPSRKSSEPIAFV